ncbi:MAG: beta-ketoacyl-ACP synthase II [Cellvibrionaceae bacterium]|nr:beta-ketoacyl-ACP synthase II [Cellvibrionaceae bacterium]
MKRVVVTGMGMISPVGNTVAQTWSAIVNGKSGVAPITQFDASAFTTHFSASVSDLVIDDYISDKEARKMDLFIQYGMIAGIQAMEDAGIDVSERLAPRFGTVIGSGIGGIGTIEDHAMILEKRGPRRISPFFVPASIVNMIAGNLSIKYGLKGPNLAVSTACTTATHAIGLASRCIRYGEADVMLAGGAEMPTTPLGLGGFAAARALSTRNDDPQAASRPWDKGRDGFVLGDGAGLLVLEEYQHAKARGATIYAELAGFGMSGDAYHMTSPPEDGAGAALSMENTLRDAQLAVDDIQYINAHGTSTPMGDLAECRAIQTVFGPAAEHLAVSSTKSMIGHLLGAAGAVEAILTVLAIRDQVAPPTINLDDPEDECSLNLVPHHAQTMKIDAALTNSFGFGGTNGSLIFKKVD